MEERLQLTDTHTHLYMDDFKEDGNGNGTAAVDRAIEAGVEKMIFPNVDESSIAPMKALAALYPGHVSMAMGLHPTEVTDAWEETLARIESELGDGSAYVAVGEVGVDLYRDKSLEAQQMEAFDRQASWAEERKLPLIIHCREAQAQVLEVLQGHPGLGAVFHSFGGTAKDVDHIRRLGDYYFGINGIVTFKNSNLRDTLPEITLERIMLETDSPYLAPVPHRGKRNESAYIVHTAAHVAASLGITTAETARATTANACALFGI